MTCMRLRVVAAAAAVVADPNADVLDLGGLNLLDLVASGKGAQRVRNKCEPHKKKRTYRAKHCFEACTRNPPPSRAPNSPQNLAGGTLGLLEL